MYDSLREKDLPILARIRDLAGSLAAGAPGVTITLMVG
jgi:hypothetical protein